MEIDWSSPEGREIMQDLRELQLDKHIIAEDLDFNVYDEASNDIERVINTTYDSKYLK